MLETMNRIRRRVKNAAPYIVTKDVYMLVDPIHAPNIVYGQIEQKDELYHMHMLKKISKRVYFRIGRVRTYAKNVVLMKIC